MRVDAIPAFYDSAKSIQEFNRDYEVTLKIAKELGVIEK